MRVDAKIYGLPQAAYQSPDGFHPNGHHGNGSPIHELARPEQTPGHEKRFSPAFVIDSPRQNLIPTSVVESSRLWQQSTFDIRNTVWPSMLTNTLGAITSGGKAVRIRTVTSSDKPFVEQTLEEHDGSTTPIHLAPVKDTTGKTWLNHDRLIGLDSIITVPVSPWGDNAVMVMSMDPNVQALSEFQDWQLQAHMQTQASILMSLQETASLQKRKKLAKEQGIGLQSIRNDVKPVYWGFNTSDALKAKGLRSVLLLHSVGYTLPDQYDNYTQDQIVANRDEQVWDDGVSKFFGNRVANHMNTEVLQDYNKPAFAAADNMGLTIKLSNFTLEDMSKPEFTKMLAELDKSVLAQIRDAHNAVYTSNFDSLHEFVKQHIKDGKAIDPAHDDFKGRFERRGRDVETTLPRSITDKLNDLADNEEARQPGGYTLGMQYHPDQGALLHVTFGFLDGNKIDGLGPVESAGIGLKRPPDPLDEATMADKLNNVYIPAMDHVLTRDQFASAA